jgi:hypothetical protein
MNGLLGKEHGEPVGHGKQRTYTVVETLAVAAGMAWWNAGADSERVNSIVRFVASLHMEHIEAEFGRGRTFAVPPIMLQAFVLPISGCGIFIERETTGPAARLMYELDLQRIWNELKTKLEKLKPTKRGRPTKQEQQERVKRRLAK